MQVNRFKWDSRFKIVKQTKWIKSDGLLNKLVHSNEPNKSLYFRWFRQYELVYQMSIDLNDQNELNELIFLNDSNELICLEGPNKLYNSY